MKFITSKKKSRITLGSRLRPAAKKVRKANIKETASTVSSKTVITMSRKRPRKKKTSKTVITVSRRRPSKKTRTGIMTKSIMMKNITMRKPGVRKKKRKILKTKRWIVAARSNLKALLLMRS